ncbi:hypothetical protein VTO42DRAFT_2730 [Malbranchea cinnamomea]
MDLNWHLFTRQANECRSNEGLGSCIRNDTCIGVSYPENLCPNDPEDVQCCFVRSCTVPEGRGYCRNTVNNGCPDGVFFPGTGPPWPCPGGNDIQCCVKSTDLVTATTATSTSTETVSLTSTSVSSQSAVSSPLPEDDSGLSAGQIAGISVGVAAAVIAIVIGLLWMYIRRRRAQKDAPKPTEMSGQAKVELPTQYERADAELPDSGPVSAFTGPAEYRDKEDCLLTSPVKEKEAVSLVTRPPVELDATNVRQSSTN